jgi:hypothetical protein
MFDKLIDWLWKNGGYQIGGYQPKPTKNEKLDPPSETIETQVTQKKLTAKEQATLDGEPYISILKVDVDPTDINNGSFELDWNDKFVINLIKSGYKVKETDTDAEIVDRWFTQVCRNVVMEVYEQEVADPEKRMYDMRVIAQKDLGDGRTEVS